MPAPVEFPEGWGIKPDMIIEMPKDVPLPATGTINYKSILVKVELHRRHVGRRGRPASGKRAGGASHERDRPAAGIGLG